MAATWPPRPGLRGRDARRCLRTLGCPKKCLLPAERLWGEEKAKKPYERIQRFEKTLGGWKSFEPGSQLRHFVQALLLPTEMGKGFRAALWRHSCAPGTGVGAAERAVRAVRLLFALPRFASPRLLSPAPLSLASKRSAALSLCSRWSTAGAAMAAGSALRAGAGLGAACWGERPLRPSSRRYLGLLPALLCPPPPAALRAALGRAEAGAGCGGAASSARRAAFVCLRQCWGPPASQAARLTLLILTFLFKLTYFWLHKDSRWRLWPRFFFLTVFFCDCFSFCSNTCTEWTNKDG